MQMNAEEEVENGFSAMDRSASYAFLNGVDFVSQRDFSDGMIGKISKPRINVTITY